MLAEILTFIFGSFILLCIIASGFALMFSRPLAGRLLQKAFTALVVLILTLALLQLLAVRFPFLWLLVLSPIAYAIWSRRHVPKYQRPLRGVERTPILPAEDSE